MTCSKQLELERIDKRTKELEDIIKSLQEERSKLLSGLMERDREIGMLKDRSKNLEEVLPFDVVYHDDVMDVCDLCKNSEKEVGELYHVKWLGLDSLEKSLCSSCMQIAQSMQRIPVVTMPN
jgi:predicted nuclease with TOPRIM domain